MIHNNKINFTRNLREAAKFRLKLRNSGIETDEKRDIESLLLSSRSFFNRLNFYSAQTNKNVRAEDISFLLKNYSFFLHYINSNLSKIEYRLESFNKDSKKYLEKIQKESILFEEQLKEIDIELNSKITKCKVYKSFSSKDLNFGYDLVDLKTNRRIKESDAVNTSMNLLKIKDIYRSKVHVENVCILKGNSFLGEFNKPLKVSEEPLNIIRDDKAFEYVVAKKENLINGMVNKHKVPEVEILFNFGLEKSLNEIHINFISELPVSLKDSKVEFFTKENGWMEINEIKSLKNRGFKDLILFFPEIKAKKIKMTFAQKKFFDTTNQDLNENKIMRLINRSKVNFFQAEETLENVKIYDLSIGDISFYHSKQSNYGFYKEASSIQVDGLVSFNIAEEFLVDSPGCHLEKSVEIILYGNSEVDSFSINENSSLRFKGVVPLASGKDKEEELLCFSNKESNCLLFPNIRKVGPGSNIQDRISVKRDGITLTMFEDYVVSLDGGETYIEDDSMSLGQLEVNYIDKVAGLFKIKLLKNENFKEDYIVTYDLDPDFALDGSSKIFMKEGLIVLSEEMRGSRGEIKPRLLLRNKSLTCDSSIISSYKVLIEEELIDTNSLTYEEILEVEGRGTSNVI